MPAPAMELFCDRGHYSPTNSIRLVGLRRTVYDMSDEQDNTEEGMPSGSGVAAQAAVPLAADEVQTLLVEVLPTAYG